jgi:translation initiation factor IF-2
VLVAKKPEEPKKPAATTADAKKPAPAAKDGKPAAAGTGPVPARATAGKEVKSAKLSSSWANDAAKKKEIKTRGDSRVAWAATTGAVAAWPSWQ